MSCSERETTGVPVNDILQLCIIDNVFVSKGSAAY